ncbi:hypothetical protein RMQ97_08500 [Maricaulis sp. D1M11]|uniref:hypothetical protein n=1 Tax=Maricaulis sp. D1M11 TaxID=3076117 RepID=UPI0039B38BDC
MLLSLHIPKTAGTAWRLFLERNLGPQVSFASTEARDGQQIASQALAFLDAGDREQARTCVSTSPCRVIDGHRARDFLDLFPEAGALAWLRDPVDRLASEFLHFRSRQQPLEIAQRVARGELDFVAFAEKNFRFYARYQERLETRPGPYCFFVDAHRSAGLGACRRHAGWVGVLPRRNVTPRSQYQQIENLEQAREHLRDVLHEEYAVYDAWTAAWADGSAQTSAKALLSLAPPPGSRSLKNQMRRRLGVVKEGLGHLLGRDWR